MPRFRWIKVALTVMLLQQVTAAAATLQSSTSIITKAGDEVTLPCDNVIKHQDKCGQTSWLSVHSERKTEELIADGQIGKSAVARAKSSRLSVTADCSLVIKNVTRQDVGRYTCRQFNKEGKQQGGDAQVFLYLINIEKHPEYNGTTFFYCAVSTNGRCEHTVQWRFEGHSEDVKTRSDSCSASVTYPTDMDQKLLTCFVTHISTKKIQQFDVNLKLLHDNTGITSSERENTNQDPPSWWVFIVVALGLAALLAAIIIVVDMKRRKRAKVNKTPKDGSMGLTLSPHTSQDTAEPEDGVAYASVSYTTNTGRPAQAQGKGDEEEAVTYSTLKSPSSPPPPPPPAAAASADLSDLYAAVNKPKK